MWIRVIIQRHLARMKENMENSDEIIPMRATRGKGSPNSVAVARNSHSSTSAGTTDARNSAVSISASGAAAGVSSA